MISSMYAVYDFTADTWYSIGSFEHLRDALEFYGQMVAAPFWYSRSCALYRVGSFDSATGLLEACPHTRVCESVEPISDEEFAKRIVERAKQATRLAVDLAADNFEGAGGEEPPVEPAENVDLRCLHPDLDFGEDAQS